MKKGYAFIYYLAFTLAVVLRLLTSSELFFVSHFLNQIVTIIIILLFTIKIILDKHSYKQLLLIAIGTTIFLYIYSVLDLAFLLITYFAFIAIKDVDIKKVVKLDIIIKSVFLLSHSFLYVVDYFFDYNVIEPLIIASKKGVSHALFFKNANTIGMLCFWFSIDCYYLENKSRKLIKSIIWLLFMLFIYQLTKCRTAFYSYLVFFLLEKIKKEKIINFLSKYAYIALATFSLIIIVFLTEDATNFRFFNGLLSGRLSFSIRAYNLVGFHFFPHFMEESFFQIFIIDNYFVKCYIHYGILTLILFYLPYLFIPRENFRKEKIFIILSAIFLFFENATINIGYAVPYLICADVIFNKKEKIINKKNDENMITE